MDSAADSGRDDVAELRLRLDEAEATIRAISRGEVDAFMVQRGSEEQVLVLEGVERPYRLLIDQMHQAALTISADGLITYANPRLGELLGAATQHLTGTPLRAHVTQESRAALDAVLEIGRRGDVGREMALERANGHVIPVHVAVSPLVEPSGIVAVIVTDLRERDRFAAEHAARTAAEATAAALGEADRRKDEFLAMLAHELRGPLAPIRNGIEVLRTSAVSGVAAHDLHDMMARQVENLVRLVDDLLDMSRVTQGKIRLQPVHIDLRTVAERSAESCRLQVAERGQSFVMSVPATPLMVEVDTVRMAQVISNLLNNAMKFTPAGGTITLEVVGREDDALIHVRDTGIGVDPSALPNIFELFVQVDPSASRAEGGLGIGLTLARRLVEMHHGHLAAHSEGLGRGAEFTVCIPLAAVAVHPTTEQTTTAIAAPAELRVLVVDDNRDAAESLALLLGLRGYHVDVLFDGESALAGVQDGGPDVVLLDIGLPGMNGYDVARELRAKHGNSTPHLVALSGYGSEEDRRRSKDAGFHHHLTKPVELSVLESLLATLPPPR